MADVSQLEINGTTYDICDATARDSLSQDYLPLTAGSNKPLTGTLYGTAGEFSNEVKVGTRLIVTPNEEGYGGIKFNSIQGIDPIKFYANREDQYGDGIIIGGGGGIVLGAGESPDVVYTNFLSENPGVEQTYITSDNNIYLLPACNTYANHPTFTFTTNANVGNSALVASAGSNSIVTIDTSSNNGVSKSGTNTIGQISITDKNTVISSIFGSETNGNSGRIRTYISAHNKKTDGTYFGGYFCMDANKDGSISYSITNPEAFRIALGASSGIWPVSLGGTGVTGHTTSKISTGVMLQKYGKLCVLIVDKSCALTSSWATVSLGTIPNGSRPATEAHGVAVVENTTGKSATISVTTAGAITVNAMGGDTLGTQYVHGSVAWICA